MYITFIKLNIEIRFLAPIYLGWINSLKCIRHFSPLCRSLCLSLLYVHKSDGPEQKRCAEQYGGMSEKLFNLHCFISFCSVSYPLWAG